MKVMIINAAIEYSTGKVIKGISDELLKNGNDVLLVYSRGKEPSGYESYKIGSKLSLYSHVLFSRFFDSQGLHSNLATKKLIKKIEDYNPDIINLHNIHGYFLNYKILFNFLNKKNIPIVWTLHDAWVVTGHCAYFDYVRCDKWKTHCKKCLGLKEYPKSILKDNSNKNFELKNILFSSNKNLTFVTPSNWLEQILKQSKLKNYKVMTINNGIDISVFTPQKELYFHEKTIVNKKMLLGVASLWNKRKGLQDFIELDKLINHDEYYIVLVGLTKEQIDNLPKTIIGLTRTNNQNELAKLYSQAEFFINPTLEDNYPTVNIEATSCGTPIIAYDTGGCKEIANLGCGIITLEKLPQSIYDAIKTHSKGEFENKCLENRPKFNSLLKYTEYLKLFNNLNEQNKN